VVSRGYKAGRNSEVDELLLVQRLRPGVLAIGDPDRVAGARRAVEAGANAVVLDDAFQHRRMHRDLDVVVIDALRPFGFGRLLPRGLLREPLAQLRRAGAIVISRADAPPVSTVVEIESRIRQFNQVAPIVRCRHRPTHLAGLDGTLADLAELRATPVVCCAGIGNFPAFVRTVEDLGARVAGVCPLSDHARFGCSQAQTIRGAVMRSADAHMLLVTEKDLVKMDPAAWGTFPLPVRALAITIQLLDDGDAIIDRLLDLLLATKRGKGADVYPQVPAG
jgi:tetraacyldisaccharide 4'-kinase